jgi:hypothetical protein
LRINPTLVKQHTRKVAPFGMLLWRQLSSGVLAAGQAGGSSSGSDRVSLKPVQVRSQLQSFGAKDVAYLAYVELPANRNLAQHVGVLLQLLAPSDDPLTITGKILTDR